jgi:hypothetical protein
MYQEVVCQRSALRMYLGPEDCTPGPQGVDIADVRCPWNLEGTDDQRWSSDADTRHIGPKPLTALILRYRCPIFYRFSQTFRYITGLLGNDLSGWCSRCEICTYNDRSICSASHVVTDEYYPLSFSTRYGSFFQQERPDAFDGTFPRVNKSPCFSNVEIPLHNCVIGLSASSPFCRANLVRGNSTWAAFTCRQLRGVRISSQVT